MIREPDKISMPLITIPTTQIPLPISKIEIGLGKHPVAFHMWYEIKGKSTYRLIHCDEIMKDRIKPRETTFETNMKLVTDTYLPGLWDKTGRFIINGAGILLWHQTIDDDHEYTICIGVVKK